jgi:large subunit ribosomal protein L24
VVTRQPRKQRKALYNLPAHQARKQISAHLAEPLLLKYNRRTTTLRKGDTVKVLRGDFKGTTGKVLEVDVSAMRVTVDGVVTKTAKSVSKPRPIHPSNLLITKLDLTDAFRRKKLGAAESDVTEEDREAARKAKADAAEAKKKRAEEAKEPKAEKAAENEEEEK